MTKYLALLVLFFSVSLFASTSHELEAEKLLEISGTKAAMETMADIMLAQQLQQNPSLAPYEKVMRDFFNKHLGYEKIKPFYISMYTETFTESELKELNDFYTTPTGRKAVEALPALMQQGGEYGGRVMQENLDELRQNITKEAERLKLLGSQ